MIAVIVPSHNEIETTGLHASDPRVSTTLSNPANLGLRGGEDAPSDLEKLIDHGWGTIPLPGSGTTLQRWQALSAVAEVDLSVVKLFEAHTDALAILNELGHHNRNRAGKRDRWAVWAAETGGARVTLSGSRTDGMRLNGIKPWCSGADCCTDALLTAWYPDGRGPQLVHVSLNEGGIETSVDKWQAVGMPGSAALEVRFHNVRAEPVGDVGDYLARPGFWQGGAGIAACWYGGARMLATTLRQAAAGSTAAPTHPFRLLALGKIDVALQSTAAILREAAAWIDERPRADARLVASRARLAAENCARIVLDEATRSLGAAPLCLDKRFARMAADLPVFVRQSHGDRDFASLGELLRDSPTETWSL